MVLHAVVMQAYVEVIRTRRVDNLVVPLGGTGISRSFMSRKRSRSKARAVSNLVCMSFNVPDRGCGLLSSR